MSSRNLPRNLGISSNAIKTKRYYRRYLERPMPFDLSQYANADPHLSSGERALSVLVGLGLTSIAAQPRPNVFLSMLALATGSYLAYRGATGYCVIKASLDQDTVSAEK